MSLLHKSSKALRLVGENLKVVAVSAQHAVVAPSACSFLNLELKLAQCCCRHRKLELPASSLHRYVSSHGHMRVVLACPLPSTLCGTSMPHCAPFWTLEVRASYRVHPISATDNAVPLQPLSNEEEYSKFSATNDRSHVTVRSPGPAGVVTNGEHRCNVYSAWHAVSQYSSTVD